MDQGTFILSRIDADQLVHIEQECASLIYRQRRHHSERWYVSPLYRKIGKVLRSLGLLVSALGIGLNAFYLLYPSACPKSFNATASLIFFALVGAMFYWLPLFENRLRLWIDRVLRRGCQTEAGRMVANAKTQAPFDAKYEIRNKSIDYSRGKNGEWVLVWRRQVSGFALVGHQVTLFFKKPNSLSPRMMILCNDRGKILAALQALGLAYELSE